MYTSIYVLCTSDYKNINNSRVAEVCPGVGQYLPAVQAVQLDTSTSPRMLLYVPIGQSIGSAVPSGQ